MTFAEAVKKLIEDPNYSLDINLLSQEDQEKLHFWQGLCGIVLNQGSIVGDWQREDGIVRKSTGGGGDTPLLPGMTES